MQKKQGISLIVLVITIIVMIILAAAVVVTLSNTGIIDRASQAVKLTDERQAQDLAALIWADAYMDENRTDTIEKVVKDKLKEQGITDAEWNINVTDNGVTVTSKNNTTTPSTGSEFFISGTWKFNDTVTLQNVEQDIEYSVGANGPKYYRIEVFSSVEPKTTSYIEYINPNATGGSVSESKFRIYTLYNGNSSWSTGNYETINFGTAPQEVSEEFYNWFTSNATQQ